MTNLEGATMGHIVRLATGLIVAIGAVLMMSGCWAIWGTPSEASHARVIAQDGNVRADDARAEREIRESSATAYAACLDEGLPGWKCEQYLWPSGHGYGAYGSGYGRRGLSSVARDAMVEIHLAQGEQEDFAQNAAIRGLDEGLATERVERTAEDAALGGRIDTVSAAADEARSRADAASARAGAAHGRLDRAARQVGAVGRRTEDLHERLRALEGDDEEHDGDKDAARKKEDEK